MSIVSRSTQQFSGFDPRSIPGCQLWLDAADATVLFTDSAGTIPVGASGNIGMWRDKSGAGRHYIQTTTGNRPSFANNTITCSTSSQVLLSSSTLGIAGIDIFVVGKPLPAAGNTWRTLFRGQTSEHTIIVEDGSSRLGCFLASGGFNQFGSLTLDGTVRSLLFVNIPANRLQSGSLNGTLALSTTLNSAAVTTDFFALGNFPTGTQPWGDINEVILVSNTSTFHRQQIEGYLAWKWGLTTSTVNFNPSTIPGCALWLDAADASTVTLSGGNVTSWNDKSGNGRNMTSTGTITYNASDRRMQLNGATSSFLTGTISSTPISNPTYIIVSRQTADPGPLFTRQTDIYGYFPRFSNGNLFVQNAEADFAMTSGLANGVDYIHSIVYDATTVNLWVLGTNIVSSSRSAFTTSALDIGARRSGSFAERMTGFIYEFLVFNTTLTTSQRQQIERYLTSKWGLQQFSKSHPYFTIPPTLRSFQPTDIDGCQLWLDAADATSVVLGSGSNISTWSDKSGNNRNASQHTTGFATYDATNIRAVITPTGNLVVPIPAGTFSTGVCAYVVFQKYGANVANGYDGLIARNGAPTTSSYPAPFEVFNDGGINGGNATSRLVGNGSTTDYGFYTVSGETIFRNTSVTLYNFAIPANITWTESVNGVVKTITRTGGAGTPVYGDTGTHVYIGTRSDKFVTANVYIYEILLYSGTHTAAQRQAVEGYLAAKWGLSTALPPAIQAVSSVFDPRTISGCSLWLDGADSSSMTLSGSNVSQWRDKSGNGRDTTVTGTPVLSNNTVLSRNGIYLNGTSSFTGSLPYTSNTLSYYIVGTSESDSSDSARLIAFSTTSNFSYDSSTRLVGFGRIGSTNQWVVYRNANLSSATLTYGAPYLLSSVIDGATNSVFLNGTNTGNVGTSGNFSFTHYGIATSPGLDSNSRNKGFVFEVLVFTAALTTAQRQQIEGYLYAKWNVPVTRHPYYRMLALPSTPLFVPSQLSGLQLWLDAADATSVVLSGSNVTQWRDKSGNGNHTNSVTGTITYASNTLLFNGSSFMFGPASNTTNVVTAFFVGYINSSTPTDGRILSMSTAGTQDSGSVSSVILFLRFSTQNAVSSYRNPSNAGVVNVNIGVPFLAATTFNGTNNVFHLNGTSSGGIASSTANFNYSRYGLGRDAGASDNQILNGGISEIIIFNAALTTSQRQAVEGYLAHKWGLQNSISATHPYRKFRA